MCFSDSVLEVVKALLSDFSVGPEDWEPGLGECLNVPLQPGTRAFCGYVHSLER